jgi:succinate dehydrogenase/fumarate reductase-like Fe-S protein
MEIRLKVFRFDPETDSLPYYTTYVLPWTEGITLLMAVRKVYETLDPTLGFRNYFCGRGLCGSCVLTVDGAVKKACHVVLQPDREYLVEPARDYPVIRDLAVDFGAKRITPETGNSFTIVR